MSITRAGRRGLTASIGVLAIGVIVVWALARSDGDREPRFLHVAIDRNGPVDPWGKSTGDIDGDSRPDLVIGGHESEELVWYRNPDWTKAVIALGHRFGTDIEVADIDGDGSEDVVSLTDTLVLWFHNPDWSSTVVGKETLHDIEVADLDGDGDIDIVGRGQSAFSGSGETVFFYEQLTPFSWTVRSLGVPDGEGLKISDVDLDGRPDVVVNGSWFANRRVWEESGWEEHEYSGYWEWPHTFVDVGDINGDGRPDIVAAPAELAGSRYRLSWFAAPKEADGVWTETVIVPEIETVVHFVGLGDLDGDGDLDVVAAEMHQGEDPDEIFVFLNGGDGSSWIRMTIAETGSHSMRMIDIDHDGDIDLFGANWSGKRQDVGLWINQTCPAAPWRRWVKDDDRPGRAVFVTTGDLDGDGFRDVAAGSWWYRNPGLLGAPWERRSLGPRVNQVATLVSLDGGGHLGALVTLGGEDEYSGELGWVRDVGAEEAPVSVANTGGDFLQGVAVLPGPGLHDSMHVALSWHGAGRGVQILTAPPGGSGSWTIRTISAQSQDEALSSGDIDGDGDPDLLLGTKWLRNDTGSWSLHTISTTDTPPDRNRLADMNGDGRLDAIVGFEAISIPGDLVWYEQPSNVSAEWVEHLIANVTGPMSLDVADIDEDGDLDVVVGEHNLADPKAAGLFVFENVDGGGLVWEREVIYVGDEHHDGAQVLDMDNDGDLDVVSIGWGHNRVVIYENRAGVCGGRPTRSAGVR